ncbi:hypothetical protein [Gloeothece verrucosa]|uniref:Uncharacterized protein n=1 Tax=Gloeothece verrucosa (strain PCC 7822) TaxID=497965 RepID=E0UEP2_GLOV7|nr:hypothetical protein [Gloeothece verrucosa]ADN16610.1 conserved hypothetical protein [Gloeothece verrucosa PCC 7822]
MLKLTSFLKVPTIGLTCLATSAGLNFSLVSQAQATGAPSDIGQCSETYITNIGTRLIDGATGEPIVNSGVSLYLNNGILLVSSNSLAEVLASKPNDKVKLCLDSVPQNCSLNDHRGKVYKVINYRTGKEFTLKNSIESCRSL